jgi:serine/threonine protein kinase/formylglycine-generating enzyme required for sulfatase activity/WD40 repeat protein
MALSVAQLSEHLIRSGLLPEEQIKASAQSVGGLTEESSAEGLAKQLVRDGRLTLFQAQLAVNGKAAALVLGSYLILEKLGQGGMGQVYKARHRTMKREVALKVISAAVVKDETSLRRFQREVEAAAQLNHPNIVTAHDAGEHKGTHFLVMELVRGADLASTVKKSGPMKAAQAMRCVLQAARGLAYAHSNGIVHRDIKPANLLLDESGTIKILDMGLARFEEAGQDHASVAGLTGTGMLMGTIDYMSPEQAMDSKTADARSDIYSLGCTLYYLVTGQAVYVEDTVMKRIMAHQAAAIPQLPILDNHLQAMFERMIAKKPEQRYQSTAELANDLQSWLTAIESDRVKATAEMPVAGGGSWDVPEDVSFRGESKRTSVVTQQPPAEQRGDTTPGASATDATIVPQSGTAAANPMAASPTKESPLSPDGKTVQRGSQTTSGQKKTLKQKGTSTNDPVVFADISQSINKSNPSRIKESGSPSRQQAASAKRESQPPRRIGTVKLVAACGGGSLILLLLGIIVIRITGKDGTESVIKVPEGTEISVDSGVGGRIEITRVPDGAANVDSAAPSQQPAWDGWPKDAPAPAIAPFDAEQAKKHQEEWAKYLNVPVEYTNSFGMKFRLIPPGEFLMGMSRTDAETIAEMRADTYWKQLSLSSAPEHSVRLTEAYYLGVTEITQEQFQLVSGKNPSHFVVKKGDQASVSGEELNHHPVESVTFSDATDFFTKLNQHEKFEPSTLEPIGSSRAQKKTAYRLPTEAEWEYGCRAGTRSTWFNGSDKSLVGKVAWYRENSGGKTHPVGQLMSNPFGLYDMHGNVWEWCHDWYDPDGYSRAGTDISIDPVGTGIGSLRVQRGGDWSFDAMVSQSGFRHAHVPTFAHSLTGFRAVVSFQAIRELIEKTASRSAQLPAGSATVPTVDSTSSIPKISGSETLVAATPAVAKPEAMTPDATAAAGPALNHAVSVAGTLAPVELRLQERAAGLPEYQNTLRQGQPLGEFAAVSNPGKVENIISWSVEPIHHRGHFTRLAVSNDGLIATGGPDNSVRLWTKDWQLIKVLPGHSNGVCSVAFSPDGRLLASVSPAPRDFIAVWDVASGQLLKYHDVDNWYGHVRWLPDNLHLLHCSGSCVERIHAFTGEKRGDAIENGNLGQIGLSPDGSRMVVNQAYAGPQIIDTASLSLLRQLDGGFPNGSVDWSHDGKWIVVSTSTGTSILDSRSFQPRHTLDSGGMARFSPDSTMLAVTLKDGLSIRRTQDWSEIRSIPVGISYDFTWSSDNRQVLTSNGCFDVQTGKSTDFPGLSATRRTSVAVSGDGRRVATFAPYRLRIWDGENGQLLGESQQDSDFASQLLWQPQGKQILRVVTHSEAIPNPLVLIDSDTGAVARNLQGHQGMIWRAAWSPDGTRIASVGEDATCRIWDAASGAELQKLTHGDPLWWIQWSNDGTKVATGSSFSAISVWEAASGKLVREFKTLSKPMSVPRTVTAADGPFGFLKGDSQLFYMAGDSGFEVLEIGSGQITSVGQVDQVGGNRLSAAWNKDFSLLGIFDGYNEFHLYSAGETKPAISIRYITSPHWLTDGRRLLGGDNYFTWLSGYDLRRKRRLGVLIPELGKDSWAALSSDGHFVGSSDVADHVVVVALHRDGRLLTMTVEEFQSQFKWTNDSKKVRFLE